MSRLIVELNDSDIALAAVSETATEIVARSPGVAVLLDDRLELGQDALDIARLHPRRANNRFWSELNQERLRYASDLARHHADLAFAHLGLLHRQAGSPDTLLFAVPGGFSEAQLSLLAGLLQAAPFRAPALIDAAAAAAAGQAAGGRLAAGAWRYLDLSLRQTWIADLQVTDTARRLETRAHADIGLAALRDRCAEIIADLFIKQSRFDPLHHAKAEQTLYHRLPEWLRQLGQQEEASLSIDYEQARHQARLRKPALAAALRPLHDKIVAALSVSGAADAGAGGRLLLHERAAAVPGLMERLAEVADIVVLERHAVFRGAALAPLPDGGDADSELPFIDEIPLPANARRGAATTTAAASQTSRRADKTAAAPRLPATHLMGGDHRAWPLTARGLYPVAPTPDKAGASSLSAKNNGIDCVFTLRRGRAVMECAADAGMKLNGAPVSGRLELRGGDTISFASRGALRAIHVMPPAS